MRRETPTEPPRVRLPRFLNAVLFVVGLGLSFFWILTGLQMLTGPRTPFGILESTDPMRGGPYDSSAPDRWMANELHHTNKLLGDLLRLLEEMKGRLGE